MTPWLLAGTTETTFKLQGNVLQCLYAGSGVHSQQ